MLEDLRRTLPRYSKYKHELPMTKALEDALSNMYTEIIIFCARAAPAQLPSSGIPPILNAMHGQQFKSQFFKTNADLRTQSRHVDEEVDMVWMRQEAMTAETIDVLESLKRYETG